VGTTHYDPVRDIVAQPPRQRGRGRHKRDPNTEDGARALAEQLTDWWHTRGYTTAQFWTERARYGRNSGPTLAPPYRGWPDDDPRHSADHGLWVVRSNLVNGLPPK
jgi:hypothetical protein